MHIFLDESGVDKQHGESSVVLVCVEIEHLVKFEASIVELERKLGIPYFHWSKSTWPVREKFIRSIANKSFSLRVAIIKNPFKSDYVHELVLNRLLVGLQVHSLVIDGKKTRHYERKLKKLLRDKGVSLKKLKTANDISFPALRIADAMAGLIRYCKEFPGNKRATNLRAIISKKIKLIIEE